jgi:type II secretory pathway pseudopilin PulG
MRSNRGFTVAEVLTVFVIVGLILGAVAAAMPFITRGPIAAQAQVDNVESSALALYKMQRDVRQSNINGVWDCTTPPVVTCTQPAPQLTNPPVQSVAIVTADDGSGQFVIKGPGDPKWSGMIVYWLTPNADGTSNVLQRAYFNHTIPMHNGAPDVNLMGPIAVLALNGVLGYSSTQRVTVAQDVRSMSVAIDTTNNIVDLQVVGGDTTGTKSSLSLTSNSYVRN